MITSNAPTDARIKAMKFVFSQSFKEWFAARHEGKEPDLDNDAHVEMSQAFEAGRDSGINEGARQRKN